MPPGGGGHASGQRGTYSSFKSYLPGTGAHIVQNTEWVEGTLGVRTRGHTSVQARGAGIAHLKSYMGHIKLVNRDTWHHKRKQHTQWLG